MSKSPEAAGRQTRTHLMEIMSANGLRPRRQLGQNFLIDLNLLTLLVQSSQLTAEDVVLEVGAGTGGMTARLAEAARAVVSVEIDPGFYRLASQTVGLFENVTLIHADILENKNKINPLVMETLMARMRECGRDHYHLVANLPYDVSASVIGNLLLEDAPIADMTFTVQLEMGERIAAVPGTAHYGPLSVLAQGVGTVEWVRTLPPNAFWPRPQIHSAILRLVVNSDRRTDLVYLRRWHRFVRDLFIHRRKNLRSGIASIPGYKWLKPELDALLASISLEPDLRAENLTPEMFHMLYQAVFARMSGQAVEQGDDQVADDVSELPHDDSTADD